MTAKQFAVECVGAGFEVFDVTAQGDIAGVRLQKGDPGETIHHGSEASGQFGTGEVIQGVTTNDEVVGVGEAEMIELVRRWRDFPDEG